MLKPTRSAVRFSAFSYPPRERWVRDVEAYKERPCGSPGFSYPPRERWVPDVEAYKERRAALPFSHADLVRGGSVTKL